MAEAIQVKTVYAMWKQVQNVPSAKAAIENQFLSSGTLTISKSEFDKLKEGDYKKFITDFKIKVVEGKVGGARTGLVDGVRDVQGLSADDMNTAINLANTIVQTQAKLDDVLKKANRETSWCYLRGLKAPSTDAPATGTPTAPSAPKTTPVKK